MINWNNDMSRAPRDGTVILGWCNHESDPYHDGDRLTTYAAHAEVFGRAKDGPQLIVWGGEYDDADDGYIPDWWFVHDRDWEIPANPTHWTHVQSPT